MPLILPSAVARELEVERQLGKSIAWVEAYNRRLRAIDPRLELIRAKDSATAPGLIPGFWHIKRENPGAPNSYIPITDEHGNFAEPGERHIEYLKSRDLWDQRVLREHERAQAARERAATRDRELAREARRDEFARNIKALASPSVFMGAKTARAKGRRTA